MNLANEKLYLRQQRMLARLCPTSYKARAENDKTWMHGRMDGSVDGREADKREDEIAKTWPEAFPGAVSPGKAKGT